MSIKFPFGFGDLGTVSKYEQGILLVLLSQVSLRRFITRGLLDVGGFNLRLLMRHLTGIGMPRAIQGHVVASLLSLIACRARLVAQIARRVSSRYQPTFIAAARIGKPGFTASVEIGTCTKGC